MKAITTYGRVKVAKSPRSMEEGLVWVEVYLPFDPPAFAEFQSAVHKHGSVQKATDADPDLADRALTPIDSHGEAMLPDDVRKLAHRFLQKSRKHDKFHDERPTDDVQLVESFVNSEEVASPHFWPGSWVVVMRVAKGSDTWRQIESGAIDAVSFQAYVHKRPVVAVGVPDAS